MKKIITILIISASLVSFSSHAQNMHRQHAGMGNMKQMLKDSLQLTDAQADSVVSIRQQSMGTMMAIRHDSSLSDDQKKQQMKEARDQAKTRLGTILSKDQVEKMEKMQREMRSEHNGGGGKRKMNMNNDANSQDSTK